MDRSTSHNSIVLAVILLSVYSDEIIKFIDDFSHDQVEGYLFL